MAALVFFTGLLFGGWWISFVLLTAVWLLALVGVIVGALALGRLLLRWMHRELHPLLAMGLGIVVIWVVGAVPFVGWLLGFAAVTFGTGATALALWGRAASPAAPEVQVYAAPQPVQPPYPQATGAPPPPGAPPNPAPPPAPPTPAPPPEAPPAP